MTPIEARAELVKALRSGEFHQHRSGLRGFSDDATIAHCCLGVACEIYRRIEGEGMWYEDGKFKVGDRFSSSYLPPLVQNWLGFERPGGATIKSHGEDGQYNTLAELNDSGHWNFNNIADLIENGGVKLREKPAA